MGWGVPRLVDSVLRHPCTHHRGGGGLWFGLDLGLRQRW